MKKSNFFFLGMAALALSFGLALAGCTEPQEVEGSVSVKDGTVTTVFPQVSAPAITEATTTSGESYLIISWNAVENASGYAVYRNQKDKTTISSLSVTPTNTTKYNADGTEEINTDSDKWNVGIPLTAAFATAPGEYRFGVSATAANYVGSNKANSDIAWGAYKTMTAHPYTAILGTWIKEGSFIGPRFVITANGSSGSYIFYDVNGSQLTSDTFPTTGTVASFSGSYYDYNSGTVSFTATLASGKLVVTVFGDNTSPLNGSYAKQ